MEEEGTILSHDSSPKGTDGSGAHRWAGSSSDCIPQIECSQLTTCPLVAAMRSYLLC